MANPENPTLRILSQKSLINVLYILSLKEREEERQDDRNRGYDECFGNNGSRSTIPLGENKNVHIFISAAIDLQRYAMI